MPVRDLIDAYPWRESPLGPRATWDPALSAAVELILGSPVPMALACGDGLVLIYNDGYAELLDGAHPAALGRRPAPARTARRRRRRAAATRVAPAARAVPRTRRAGRERRRAALPVRRERQREPQGAGRAAAAHPLAARRHHGRLRAAARLAAGGAGPADRHRRPGRAG